MRWPQQVRMGWELTGASNHNWQENLQEKNISLQGNFDPAKLLSPIPVIEKEVKQMMDAFGPGRHIANLGHGILPNVPVDHARAFVDSVKNYRHELTK
jgi:uroporphyrinogen decarboxylase